MIRFAQDDNFIGERPALLRGCPAGRARCARGDHFVVGMSLCLLRPLVGMEWSGSAGGMSGIRPTLHDGAVKDGAPGPWSLSERFEGDGLALLDAHLSDDEAVAKMGPQG